MTTELLELLWVIEHTVAMENDLGVALDEIVARPCFQAEELPTPEPRERQAPFTRGARPVQVDLV